MNVPNISQGPGSATALPRADAGGDTRRAAGRRGRSRRARPQSGRRASRSPAWRGSTSTATGSIDPRSAARRRRRDPARAGPRGRPADVHARRRTRSARPHPAKPTTGARDASRPSGQRRADQPRRRRVPALRADARPPAPADRSGAGRRSHRSRRPSPAAGGAGAGRGDSAADRRAGRRRAPRRAAGRGRGYRPLIRPSIPPGPTADCSANWSSIWWNSSLPNRSAIARGIAGNA